MNALVASMPLGAALLALVVAGIVGLHLRRPRPARRIVASTLLWERAAKRAGIRDERWRWWLALGLALAIGVLCVVVLTRPEVQGFGDGTRRTLVVVDNGPSLATRTRDGQSRWQHASAIAREVILGAPGPVMVVDSTGTAPGTGFVARDEALAALERFGVGTRDARVSGGLPGGPELDVHVIGDGVAGIEVPPGATVHSVFEPADNVAVLRLAVRPSPADPLQVEAFVQVFNASPTGQSVRLMLRGGERFSATQSLAMAPGEIIDATFDVSPFEGGVLAAAAHVRGDALPQDDIAYAVVGAHRTKRVMLVTRGNPALADSLAALTGVRLEVVDPSRYRPQSDIDAFVFDGFAPPQPPPAGALLFWPAAVSWLPRAERGTTAPTIDQRDRGGAVTAGVAWDAVTVRRAALWTTLPEGVSRLVESGTGALVVAGRAGGPWIAAGFLTGDSDLPLQPAFPIFLGNAIARLTETDAVQAAPLGLVRVALVGAEVRDGQGAVVVTRAIPGATLFEAVRPDIYTARAPGGRVRVAAAVLDPRIADVNRSLFGAASAVAALGAGLPMERWGLLVCAVVVLLLLDWVAFTHPEALWLLATLPIVWLLAALARRDHTGRRLASATFLRSVAIASAVLALAQPRTQARSDAVSVVYAIDVSRSVSPRFLDRALDGIHAGDAQHQPAEARYVVFADRPKAVGTIAEIRGLTVSASEGATDADAIGQTATDIEQALRAAMGSFGASGARRLVLISDGNQTRGDLWRMLPRLQSEKVRVFTVPAEPAVAIDAIVVPDGVRQQAPVTVVVKVHAITPMAAKVGLESGVRRLGVVQVTLRPGDNSVAFDVALATAGSTALRATVQAEADLFPGNDSLEARVWVGPRPRVLYVEGVPESARHLADALRTHHVDVTVAGPDARARELASVASFDAVILSDVWAQSLDAGTVGRLETFVRDAGGGLVFIAGESTHGQDGLAGSALERLLPVRFEARRKKRDLDLVLLIDRSHSMRGRKLELAKTAALSTLDLLEPRHRLAVIAFDSQPHEVVPLAPVGNKRRAEDLIASMTARGQTSIHPALVEARRLLRDSTATTRHIILLSDGITAQPMGGASGMPNAKEIQALIQKGREEAMRRDGIAVPRADPAEPVPEPGAIEAVAAELAEAKITLSTIALGDKPKLPLMGDLAALGGGRAYIAGSDAELPGLFVAEARRLLGESLVETSFRPVVAHRVAALEGLDFTGGPALRGMVAARAKAFADVLLQGPKELPLLVTTHYGLGRTAAFLSDAKNRWAADWIGWDGYGRFWAQVVRDTMRTGDDGALSLRVTRAGRDAVVELRALGPDHRHRNSLAPLVRVTDPQGGTAILALQQVAPGRYSAEQLLEAGRAQPYRFDLMPGGGLARTDVAAVGTRALSYAWSDEFRALPPDLDTLRALSEATGGVFAPTAADIHAIRGDGGLVVHALWPWCVAGSLVAYLLDLVARRAPWRLRWWPRRGDGGGPGLRRPAVHA